MKTVAVMKTIMIGAVAASLALPASATEWYMLDASKAVCYPIASVAPLVPSPYAYEQGLRSLGLFKDLRILTLGPPNPVAAVGVQSTDDSILYFFSTNQACVNGLQRGVRNGIPK